jgi:hypothetical protein
LSPIKRSLILHEWVKEINLIVKHERVGKNIPVERWKGASAT